MRPGGSMGHIRLVLAYAIGLLRIFTSWRIIGHLFDRFQLDQLTAQHGHCLADQGDAGTVDSHPHNPAATRHLMAD